MKGGKQVDRTSAQGLIVSLRGRLGSLSPTERALAEQVLADPGGVAALSIGQLAARAGVSDTSVTRFCRMLGLRGYPDLRLALAAAKVAAGEEFAVRVGIDDDITEADDTATLVAKVARLAARAAEDTARLLDPDALRDTVGLLVEARRVEVFTAGAGAVVAADLEYKLQHLGLACTAHTDVHRSLMAAAHLTRHDVAIGISYSGRTREVLDPLAEAGHRGAATVALTGDPASPLAKAAGRLLTFAGQETPRRTGATVSRIGQLTVVDCLYAALAQHPALPAAEALSRTHEAVSRRRP